jgi:hypothetical protein
VVRTLLSRALVLTLLMPLTRAKLLLLANALLQLVDGYVTLIGTGRGFMEGNPLVRGLMAQLGPAGGLVLVKLMALGFLYYLYKRRTHPLAEPGLAYLAVVYVTMAVLPWTMLLAAQPG